MITKEALDKFRTHMTAAAKEAGIDLKMGSITYNDNYFSFSSKAYLVGGDGKKEEFMNYAGRKNVPTWMWNFRFRSNKGDVFTVTGILPRGRKNVLEITRHDGVRRICSVDFVDQYRDQLKQTGPKRISGGGMLV